MAVITWIDHPSPACNRKDPRRIGGVCVGGPVRVRADFRAGGPRPELPATVDTVVVAATSGPSSGKGGGHQGSRRPWRLSAPAPGWSLSAQEPSSWRQLDGRLAAAHRMHAKQLLESTLLDGSHDVISSKSTIRQRNHLTREVVRSTLAR
jgi:hypothetical protein